MSERFLKFIPSEEAMFLLMKKGHAFRLLTIIAEAARRYEGLPDGLHIGKCYIGGFENYDMTERNYRTAKKILEKRGHIEIVETCRSRKKSTDGTTTIGTRVKLKSVNVWEINANDPADEKCQLFYRDEKNDDRSDDRFYEEKSSTSDDRNDDRATTERRPSDDKQERIRKIKKEKEEQNIAQSAPPLRIKNDNLFFNFETWQFEGISPEDRKDWSAMYPHVDLDLEIKKASQWLKANPSKSGKKLWRKFLTGWFTRTNDSAENKKAFKNAGSFGLPIDRRTKNMDGTPMKSKAEDLF